MWPFRKKVIPLGQRGEDLACAYLKKQGYKILDRNVRLARCEIDIVAQEHDTIAFVEVKTRGREGVCRPEDSVGYTKQRHIVRAADCYMARYPDRKYYVRFDVVAIVLADGKPPEIELLRDAFTA